MTDTTKSTTTPADVGDLASLTGRRATSEDGAWRIELTRDYAYALEDVWSVWTEPDRLARWLGNLRGQARLGADIELVMSPPEGDVARMRILACEAPRSLSVRWAGFGEVYETDEPPSQVDLELVPLDATRTRVVLVHRELTEDGAAGYGAGWEEFLQLAQDVLAGTGDRENAPYDREAVEAALRTPWQQVITSADS